MPHGDELKLQRCAAADAEQRARERERKESRSCTPTVWRRCLKFLNLSRQFTVLHRDSLDEPIRIEQKLVRIRWSILFEGGLGFTQRSRAGRPDLRAGPRLHRVPSRAT